MTRVTSELQRRNNFEEQAAWEAAHRRQAVRPAERATVLSSPSSRRRHARAPNRVRPHLQRVQPAMQASAGAAAQRAACARPRPASRTASAPAGRDSCAPPRSCSCAAARLPRVAGGARRATRARAAPGTAGGPDERLADDLIAGFDPMEEVGVPRDQRPVNELAALRETFLYDWAPLPLPALLQRCGGLFAAVFFLLAVRLSRSTAACETPFPWLRLDATPPRPRCRPPRPPRRGA